MYSHCWFTKNARSKEKNDFIVDDDLEEGGSVDRDDGSGNEEDDDDNMFDSVCSICDEGGSILWYVSAYLDVVELPLNTLPFNVACFAMVDPYNF